MRAIRNERMLGRWRGAAAGVAGLAISAFASAQPYGDADDFFYADDVYIDDGGYDWAYDDYGYDDSFGWGEGYGLDEGWGWGEGGYDDWYGWVGDPDDIGEGEGYGVGYDADETFDYDDLGVGEGYGYGYDHEEGIFGNGDLTNWEYRWPDRPYPAWEDDWADLEYVEWNEEPWTEWGEGVYRGQTWDDAYGFEGDDWFGNDEWMGESAWDWEWDDNGWYRERFDTEWDPATGVWDDDGVWDDPSEGVSLGAVAPRDDGSGRNAQRENWNPNYGYDLRTRQPADRRADSAIAGTLAGWKKADIEGAKKQHTLVRIRLKDGTTRVVNLGPNATLDDLKRLGEAGDRIAITGRPGRIDGQRVLMAKAVAIVDRGDRTPDRAQTLRGLQRPGDARARDAREDRRRHGVVSGQLERIENVFLRDDRTGRRDLTLARVHLADGRKALVDLGGDVNVERLMDKMGGIGDPIKMTGRVTRFRGQPLLVVTKVQFNGDMASIPANRRTGADARRDRARPDPMEFRASRRDEARMPRMSYTRAQSMSLLRGEVSRWEKVRLDAAPEDHTIVKLKLEDGTTELIDLGPGTNVTDLDIDVGSRINVAGERKTIGGREVLRAQRVWVEGHRVPVS